MGVCVRMSKTWMYLCMYVLYVCLCVLVFTYISARATMMHVELQSHAPLLTINFMFIIFFF